MRFYILVFFIISGFLPANEIIAQQSDYKSYFENSGEMYFSISIDDPAIIPKLSHLISIDNFYESTIYAYANKAEFQSFLALGLSWTILPKPSETGERPKMLDVDEVREINSWDVYPTYEAYLAMVNQFALDFPDICQVFSIGQSTEGRELMMIKISDSVDHREAEPQFLYTGTIHGDELLGYILLLRLADYLLNNYYTNPEIANLVNSTEIWINPLANPDGTFAGGNNTVWGSTRYNANNIDLNRNYPDPENGPHPDGNDWQPETLLFMQLAEENNFVMSANTHGGAEVINYPWDTWSRLAADDSWWQFVSREYADTVHVYAPTTYLDGFVNGITNGYAWYTVNGGRQDYMNYFHHCREVTMELSNTKKLQTTLLDVHWNYNYRSLINYIRQVNYGISGKVTVLETGEPLVATVFIDGHDFDNSYIISDEENGFYQRLLEAGTYNLTFSADGYEPVTISGVEVSRYNNVNLDVGLSAGELHAEFSANSTSVSANSFIDFSDQSTGAPVSWSWQFPGATPDFSVVQYPANVFYEIPGSYNVSLTVTNSKGEQSTLVKKNYIQVSAEYLISNQNITVANGLFYDTGGESGNYQDDEDFTMSIYPAFNESKIMIEFLEFHIESNSSCNYDWFRVYDGASVLDPILGTWCGDDSPGSIIATNSDGVLTVKFHSDYSVNLSGWKASIKCICNQELSLDDGWGGVSLFVNPVDPFFENIFAGVMEQLVIIIGEEGMYWPAENINTLNTWNSTGAYIIKMSQASILAIDGGIESARTLNFLAGWNYFPVLCNKPLMADELAYDLNGSLVLIKEIAGVNTYWPEMGIFTLQGLQPGNAYLLLLLDDRTYIFPDFE
ncbi:MAG: carboxypeptidase regulatory-like domain-containing protein [Bacteroidales bacterium]|nr:carboxypeptidase regulatory-like domain-containing protein [Bacteroidales bacterium]